MSDQINRRTESSKKLKEVGYILDVDMPLRIYIGPSDQREDVGQLFLIEGTRGRSVTPKEEGVDESVG